MASPFATTEKVRQVAPGRPSFRVAFNRFPGPPARERLLSFESEFPGEYRLASVNEFRVPYIWQSPWEDGGSEWLLSGRVFVREDRSWVVRLASSPRLASISDTCVTVVQGTWAPALMGQLAVRTSDGYAGAWLANGRSILMRGVIGPEQGTSMEVMLRFTKWREREQAQDSKRASDHPMPMAPPIA